MQFQLQANDISFLFDPDNIRMGDSVARLAEWGRIQGLQSKLHTNLQRGIVNDEKDHRRRGEAFGDNIKRTKPTMTIWKLMQENFEDQIMRIFAVLGLVSLVLEIATEGLNGGWLESASILIALFMNLYTTSVINYLKTKEFEKLNATISLKEVNVYREGELMRIPVEDVYVGDIAEIQPGQILSFDGILINGEISVDESSITGQTQLIRKRVPLTYEAMQRRSPFLISSSKVFEGTGQYVVCAVGNNSYYGKLKLYIQTNDDSTPLQQKLASLADSVGRVAMFVAFLTLIFMFLHYIYDCIQTENFFGSLISINTVRHIIHCLVVAFCVIMVLVPEGLPLALTTSLAYSVNKMKDENVLVRYLQTCQTMESIDNIICHQSVLKKNIITLRRIFIEENSSEIIDKSVCTEQTCRLLCLSVINNSTANPKIMKSEMGTIVEQVGNKTECALLEMAFEMGYDYKELRQKDKQKKTFPFSPEKKKMCTVYEDDKGKNYVFVKGAPYLLLPSCSRYINKHGTISKIDSDFSNYINSMILDFATQSLGTLLLAYKEVNEVPGSWEEVQQDLIFIGMIGFKNPLKSGIRQAVEQCHSRGVKVRMITGDDKNRAIAVAKEAGILESSWQENDDLTVMEGKKFREYVGHSQYSYDTDNQYLENIGNFEQVAEKLCVLAHSYPTDNYTMAVGFRQLKKGVAMTGADVNDAPFLKKADVGFAMGISGTETAKEASGIVLLDDNFKSILTALKWGRNVFDCLRKHVQFYLTANFVAVAMILIGCLFFGQSPLNPVQMLWISLVIDILATLALATEPPTSNFSKNKPKSRDENLITSDMWRNIIVHSAMQILLLTILLFKSPAEEIEIKKHYSIFFNVFVLLQVFNEINSRKLSPTELNVFQNLNPFFLTIFGGTIIAQLVMVNFGSKLIGTVELSVEENVYCIVLGTLSIWYGIFMKMILPEHIVICRQGIEFGRWVYYWSAIPQND